MPGSGSEGVSQNGKTSAFDDFSLLLARWEGPVCTLLPVPQCQPCPSSGYHCPFPHQLVGGVREWEAMDFGFIM